MKKILAVFFTTAMLLTLAGCSLGEKPDKVVTAYCEALKNFDSEAASACVASGETSLEEGLSQEEEDNAIGEQMFDYVKQQAGKLTYTVGEATVDGDQATVPVTFTYVDASAVIQETMSDYIEQGLGLAFSGASEEEIENLFIDIFNEKLSSVETGTATTDVVFPCEKVDGEWKISDFSEENEDALMQVVTCNMVGEMEEIGSSDSEEEPAEEEAAWQDISMGQELELATIKIRITGCEETNELTTEYMDPDVAQDGTKFVVFTVEVENITKDTLNFDNDLNLEDSQGRTYEPYSDALWYFDETFTYTDLAPNIKTTGNFVYNVPTDSEGYFLKVGKSGTNEMYRLYGA